MSIHSRKSENRSIIWNLVYWGKRLLGPMFFSVIVIMAAFYAYKYWLTLNQQPTFTETKVANNAILITLSTPDKLALDQNNLSAQTVDVTIELIGQAPDNINGDKIKVFIESENKNVTFDKDQIEISWEDLSQAKKNIPFNISYDDLSSRQESFNLFITVVYKQEKFEISREISIEDRSKRIVALFTAITTVITVILTIGNQLKELRK